MHQHSAGIDELIDLAVLKGAEQAPRPLDVEALVARVFFTREVEIGGEVNAPAMRPPKRWRNSERALAVDSSDVISASISGKSASPFSRSIPTTWWPSARAADSVAPRLPAAPVIRTRGFQSLAISRTSRTATPRALASC